MINKNAIEVYDRLTNGLRGMNVSTNDYFVKRGEIMEQAFNDGLLAKRYIPECPIYVAGMIHPINVEISFTTEG